MIHFGYRHEYVVINLFFVQVLRLDTVLHMLSEYAATKGAHYKRLFLEDVVGKHFKFKNKSSFAFN